MPNIQPADISIKNVYKQFKNNAVLKGVNLDIKGGEFFTLLGSSGCGKTTLLRIIAGFEEITSGEILLNGSNILSLNAWERNVGFVFQNYALWPHMTIYDNIAYGLKLRKMTKDQIKERVEWGLEVVGLSGCGDRFPSQISGGQQQRVAIARVLVIEPKVLLLDEPLSNLDAKLRVSLRKDIKDLQKKFNITTIYVTHDQEEALEISDRIAVIEKGIVQQVGTPREIYKTPANHFVSKFVGTSNFIPSIKKDGGVHSLGGQALTLPHSPGNFAGGFDVCFRPEHVQVFLQQQNDSVRAIVKDTFYRGSSVCCQVEVEPGVTCIANIDEEPAVGSALWLKINDCIFLERGNQVEQL